VRDGAHFSDGTEVTPDDVAYSLRRRLVAGSPWREALADVESVEVSGQRKVTVQLERPNVLVNDLLATAAGTVVSRAALLRTNGVVGSQGRCAQGRTGSARGFPAVR
jgi:peptide/nickel transport system substrate-binding protein